MYFSLSILLKSSLKTEFSIWFLPLCLLLGLLYAFLLYQRKSPWSKETNYLLATARGLVASLIAFFLLGPLLNQISFVNEDAIVVLNIDNSESINSGDSVMIASTANQIKETLESEGIDVRLKGLTNYLSSDQFSFSENSTNLSGSLQSIGQDFERLSSTHLELDLKP